MADLKQWSVMMILGNFLYRVGQWLRDNEQRIIKAMLVIFGAILVIFLVIVLAQKWSGTQ